MLAKFEVHHRPKSGGEQTSDAKTRNRGDGARNDGDDESNGEHVKPDFSMAQPIPDKPRLT